RVDRSRGQRSVREARLALEGRAAEIPLRRQVTLNERAAAAGPHLLRIHVATRRHREACRCPGICERLQQLTKLLCTPEELPGRRDVRTAARGGVQVQHREEAVGR